MKNLFLTSILLMVFSGGIKGQTRDDFKRWHFGIEGSIGMGRIHVLGYSTNFLWRQGGISSQYMFNSILGLESGVLYSKTNPITTFPDYFFYLSSTSFSRVEAKYIDIPLNVVFKPAYTNPNKNVSFTLNGGIQLNIPLVERGYSTTSHLLSASDQNELSTGNPSEVRLYANFMPGWEFRFWKHTGMFIRFKIIVDPKISTNTSDFQYSHFFGLSLGFNS